MCLKLNNKSTLYLLNNLWAHIPIKRKSQLFGLLSFSILASIVEIFNIGLVFPFLGAFTSPEKIFEIKFLKPIFYKFNILNPSEILFPMTILFVVAAIFSSVTRLLMLSMQSRFSYSIGADISISCYRNMLYSPYLTIVSKNTSEYITGMVDKNRMIVTQVILPVLSIMSASIIFVAIFITLLVINPFIALSATFAFSSAYVLLLFLIKKRLIIHSQDISRKSNQLIQNLQEGFGGIRDVIIDGTQEIYCKIFNDIDVPLRKAESSISIIGQSPRFVIEAFGMIVLALIAFSLSFDQGGIKTAIPILGVFALGAHRLLPVLQQIYQGCTSIFGCKTLLKDILFYLNQKLSKDYSLSNPPLIKFNKSIKLKKLNFRYDKNQPLIINDFSFTIKKGEIVGFFGDSGSGKSTLMDIVMRLINAESGELLIDDKKITSKNYRSWQLHLAHVPQNIFLADSTITENIAFGTSFADIDHDLVRSCAKQAQIAETIESWPLKYNTLVGERGIKISGGQKQRIGIARALYKKTDVIIFDEATNALDIKTESAIMKAILDLDPKITILFISHRPETLKYCTKIVELKHGMLARQGSFKEIIGNKNIIMHH